MNRELTIEGSDNGGYRVVDTDGNGWTGRLARADAQAKLDDLTGSKTKPRRGRTTKAAQNDESADTDTQGDTPPGDE